jgi:hypothetical protein
VIKALDTCKLARFKGAYRFAINRAARGTASADSVERSAGQAGPGHMLQAHSYTREDRTCRNTACPL